VCDYVQLNPARAKLLRPDEPLRAYPWSSWPEYLKTPGQRWPWLRVGRLLGENRIPRDSLAGRRQLEALLEPGGRRSRARITKRFAGVGAWETKPFAKSCWAK